YKRACYLEGTITSAANGTPVNKALVEILSSTTKEETIATGHYTLGQATPGTVQVKISKIGFNPVTTTAVLVEGEVTILDVALTVAPSVSINGQVLDAATGLAVPGAQVAVFNNQISFETTVDANGQFNLPAVFLGTYSVVAGAWGYKYAVKNNQNLTANQTYTLELDKGYRDDFIFDYGWEVSGTSTEGVWERGEPVGIDVGIILAPETDLGGDVGNLCYVTGNSTGAVDVDDVENGTMNLLSPPMDLSDFNDPIMIAFMFFTSFTQDNQSLDSIRLYADNGIEETLLLGLPGNSTSWKAINLHLKDKIALTDNVRIRIECFDNPAYQGFDSYEAAFDFFRVAEGNPTSTGEPTLDAVLTARPNPFKSQMLLEYKAPEGGSYQLGLFDLLGRRVESVSLEGAEGVAVAGQSLRPGIYFARLERDGQVSKTIRVVKID
ncbi:MAG TPA: carboxypeptidase regulatory-like domain-containing protein, partial [Saprospiraceae bacterium]|nr:carboxypeptidase regulatory-like domain-containing protein [Saprospiraceae bacterium]